MSDYLMDSAMWSIAGLAVGYLLGNTEVKVRSYLRRRNHDNT